MYPGQGAQGARANPSCVMSPVSGKCQTLVHTGTGSGIKIALRQLAGWWKSTYILLKAGSPILRLLCCRSELLYLTQRIFPKHKVSVKTCFHFHILTSITSTLPVSTEHVLRCMSCMRLSPHTPHTPQMPDLVTRGCPPCQDNTPAWPALYTNSTMSRSVISVLISLLCATGYWSTLGQTSMN